MSDPIIGELSAPTIPWANSTKPKVDFDREKAAMSTGPMAAIPLLK